MMMCGHCNSVCVYGHCSGLLEGGIAVVYVCTAVLCVLGIAVVLGACVYVGWGGIAVVCGLCVCVWAIAVV